MNKRANIKDVSRIANVSTSTVSNYLNKTVPVKKETAKRIREAIDILDYHPNIPARNLRNMSTKSILVIVANIDRLFFYEVIHGIESITKKYDYQMLFANAQDNLDTERILLNLLRQKQFDGILMLTARERYEKIENIAKDFPLVLACQYYKTGNLPTVSINNISASMEGTKHLIKMGHKRIAFINGPSEIIVFKDRLEGYLLALKESGLKIEPSIIQEGKDCSFESGYRLACQILNQKEKISAMFATSDEMSIGVIKAIKNNNLKIPEDVAVLGFDDTKLVTMSEPDLSTIKQPAFEIGKKAIELLIKLIENKKINNKKIILDHKLIIRKSCGYYSKNF